MKRAMMIAYAQYFNDARIKSYVHAWLDRGAAVDVLCLRDPEVVATGRDEGPEFHAWLDKYQGESALRYSLSYFRFFVGARKRVRQLLTQRPYDAIHVHNMPDALVFCVSRGRRWRRRYRVLILDMHDVMPAAVMTKFSGWRQRLWFTAVWWQTKLSARRADLLIHADHSQMDLLAEYGIAHPRRMVYLNLPDPRWFHERPPRPPGSPIRVVYHGSITRRSGLDLAVEAVSGLAGTHAVTLTLIGDGDLRPELERRCREAGLLGRVVFFKDFMSVERLQAEIEQYDIGVVANRRSLMSERCMLPVKLMEYVKIGLPVVVPRLPVIQRYFAEDMVQYFEPDRVADLQRALRELIERPDEWSRRVERARQFFQAYSPERQQAEYFQIIEEIAARRP